MSNEPAPVLLDVTPQTLGVRTVGDMIEAIIPRNSPIPTTESKVFHTVKDNQTEVRIKVYQGDAREARSNYLLGEFVLDGLPAGPRGHAKVKVSFSIDADGMVNVVATASETGSTKEMRLEASSSLSRGEVESLRFDEGAAADSAPEAVSSSALDDDDDLASEDMLTAEAGADLDHDDLDLDDDDDDLFFDDEDGDDDLVLDDEDFTE